HLKENDTFELSSWVESLKQDAGVAERIKQTYQRCTDLTANIESAPLLLWRGREMVEILVTLSMDKDTLTAALLFPLVEARVYPLDKLKEDYSST
ncbi:GTP diphosphokinase, partial [Vibrio natriegens]